MRNGVCAVIPSLVSLVLAASTAAAAGPTDASDLGVHAIGAADVEARLERYAPADLGPEGAALSAGELKLLGVLVDAARAVDTIYWSQVSPDGPALVARLEAQGTPRAKALARLLALNYGPWDRFRGDEPLVGVLPKPVGAAFYPDDLSPLQLEQALADRPEQRDALLSPYTLVRRNGDGLVTEPYSQAFRAPLETAAKKLKEAAGLSSCKPLARFLELRAADLLSDRYVGSEMQWMNTGDCRIEVVLGPYETYEDGLAGVKTAFEAIVAVRDHEASRAVAGFPAGVTDVMARLPLRSELRTHLRPVPPSPLSVADVVYTAGDARARFQVSAFTLPNDERVRAKKGTKNVVLRNVVEAKFVHLFRPIAERLLCPKRAAELSAQAFLDLVLMWNLAYSVGSPTLELPGGEVLALAARLKERQNVIDLVRADALALVNGFHLAEKGLLPRARADAVACAYVDTIFATVRYGGDHAMAKTIVYNWLAAEGALRYDPKQGRFTPEPAAVDQAARKLAVEALRLEALGDYEGAGQLIVRYGLKPAEVSQALGRIADVPVDITPVYTIER